MFFRIFIICYYYFHVNVFIHTINQKFKSTLFDVFNSIIDLKYYQDKSKRQNSFVHVIIINGGTIIEDKKVKEVNDEFFSYLLNKYSIKNKIEDAIGKANETLTTLRKNIDELLEVLTKEDISHIMTLRPARDYIYVIAFNIATNLFMIYKNDPDYAFYLVYKIINLDLNMNKEEYFKQLQCLDITNIKNTKEYNELILSRCRSIQK